MFESCGIVFLFVIVAIAVIVLVIKIYDSIIKEMKDLDNESADLLNSILELVI